MVDNLTNYLDDHYPSEALKWVLYFPKPKEGKKPLPEYYHYFKVRLYNNGPYFLFLSFRYDSNKNASRLRINGSIKKWFLGDNTRKDLTPIEFFNAITLLAEKIGVSNEVIMNARVTKLETGVTVLLKHKFKEINKCFVWYKSFDRIEENETTLYFKGKNYSFILYEKYIEMKSKNYYRNGRWCNSKNVGDLFHFLRFEVKINKVSGVTFYKEKANTLGKILENWNPIICQIQRYIESIKFIDLISAEKEFRSLTYPDLKKYLIYKGIKNEGLLKTLELMRQLELGTNKSKQLDDLFNIFRSHITDEINLRDELLYEFEKKINRLLYNKSSN